MPVGSTIGTQPSSKYHEGSRRKTRDVIADKNPQNPMRTYPATHEFSSSPAETASKIEERRSGRRHGGSLRGPSHGFHSIGCTCNGHPCVCGTEAASAEAAVKSRHMGSSVKVHRHPADHPRGRA